MKKSLLFGAALAIAFAGNAKEASHVQRENVNFEQSAVKAADLYSNVSCIDATRELSKKEIKGLKEAATAIPAAYYKRPAGTTYIGMSPSTYNLKYSFLAVPAYTELNWKNASVGATSILWEYCDGILPDYSDFSYAQSTAEEITTPKYTELGSYSAPYLQASNELGDSIFTTVDYLSIDPYIYIESINEYFYNTNMRYDADLIAYIGATMINNAQSAKSLDSKYGFTEAGFTDVKLDAVAELYRKPAKPYLLSSICAHLCDLNAGAQPLNVKATVYSVTLDEDGDVAELGDVLFTGSGDNSMYESGRQWQTIVWEVAGEDAAGRPTDLIIDDNILVVLEAEDEATSFAQYLWASPSAFVMDDIKNTLYDEDVCSYVIASASANGERGSFILPYAGAYYMDDNVTVGAMKSFPIQILAETYYLDSEETEFIAPTETESSKTFAVNSFYSCEAWSVYAEDYNGEEADWIEFGLENVMTTDDAFTGVVNTTLTVGALPEGLTGREANVEISYLGAVLNIHVLQGESGVKGVTVKSANYVNVVGDDFVVKAASDVTKAEVYTAAGVKVAEAAVNGTTSINAAGLANGVYFVKLNNGKTVKVVK